VWLRLISKYVTPESPSPRTHKPGIKSNIEKKKKKKKFNKHFSWRWRQLKTERLLSECPPSGSISTTCSQYVLPSVGVLYLPQCSTLHGHCSDLKSNKMYVGSASRGSGEAVRPINIREERNSYPGLGRAIVIFQFEPTLPLGRCTRKLEDNIKLDIMEIGCQGVD
jgi:hypothetical protein